MGPKCILGGYFYFVRASNDVKNCENPEVVDLHKYQI